MTRPKQQHSRQCTALSKNKLFNFYEIKFTGDLIEADHCRQLRAVLLTIATVPRVSFNHLYFTVMVEVLDVRLNCYLAAVSF